MIIKTCVKIVLAFTVVLAMLGSSSAAIAAPPNGVDHLRGRWDGVVEGLFDGNQTFILMLDEFHPDPNDSSATLYNGCMAVGTGAAYAPVSARFVSVGGGNYDMTLFGTAGGVVIKLVGTASTNDATVTDDPASGAWQTAEQTGTWSAYHHDRREPKCPAVQLGDGLYFFSSVNGVVNINPDESRFEQNILDGSANIVSSGMQVVLPDGSTVVVPFYTDLFSPSVDFISEFRFLEGYSDLPVVGRTYTFTLLDVFGDPIPGTTQTDVWYACTMDAPRNVSAFMDMSGMQVTWDAVAPAAGFDPTNQLGFYQIELYPDAGGGFVYGSNGILSATHTIPLATFNGNAPGSPDGYDLGASLSELPDRSYSFDVISFSEGFNPGSVGLECQIRHSSERQRFTKEGDAITITNGDDEPISDTLIVAENAPVQIAVAMLFDWPQAQDMFDAVQMAIDDHGTIQGFSVQQNQYDAGCDSQTGEDAANAIIANAQNAGVVGPFCSVSTEGALPILEDVSMVMISFGNTRPSLPSLGPTMFNRVVVTDPDFDNYWHAQISSLQSVLDWEADFAARYGRAPSDLARYAYDATLVLLSQIEATGGVNLDGDLVIDRNDLAAAVRGTTGFPGVTGIINLDADGNRIP